MHACVLLILPCFTQFSRVYLTYSVVSKLFESAWSGAKAFHGATAFNANIGSWNTASITSMSYVCALCHRPRVRRGWLGLGRGAALRGLDAVGRGRSSPRPGMHAFCFPHSSVLHSFLENTSHTS
jgi:surface protein